MGVIKSFKEGWNERLRLSRGEATPQRPQTPGDKYTSKEEVAADLDQIRKSLDSIARKLDL